MHEMSYVRNILEITLEEARNANASCVRTVHIVIGESHDIVDEYFQGLFRHLAKGTIAENAEIALYRIPYTVECRSCGLTFPVKVQQLTTWVCPHCETELDFEIKTGREFFINKIEVS